MIVQILTIHSNISPSISSLILPVLPLKPCELRNTDEIDATSFEITNLKLSEETSVCNKFCIQK